MKIAPYTNSMSSSAAGRVASFIKPTTIDNLNKISHGVVILGLADDQGVKNVGGRPGACEGPNAFRGKFYRLAGSAFSFPLYDLGDLLPAATIEDTHAAAQAAIQMIHAAGHFPLIIGGGHDLAFPEAAALLEHMAGKPVQFVNLDAHLDLRNTLNGITSGSPWYLLAESSTFKSSKSTLVEIGVQQQCNTDELIEYAQRHKIKMHWLRDLREKNTKLETLLSTQLKSRHSLVSLDIDGVRWSDAPGCSAPQNTGFSAEEALRMCLVAGKMKTVKSFGIYELSPPLDRDGQTAALVARCVYSFLEGYSNRFKVRARRVQSKSNGTKEKNARRRK